MQIIVYCILNVQCDFDGHIHQYQKVAPIYHFIFKKSRGEGESWDLFSNQYMGLVVQKNLGFLVLSEVEGVVNHVFLKRPIYG